MFHPPPPPPLIFAIHGHGGTAKTAANGWGFHTLWPQAIVVYPQGLATASKLDPKGEKSGWQNAPGVNGDRDLKFFDTMLASLRREYKVDDRRIYATGNSNGGGFTYLLWETHGDVFAAVAPSAAGCRRVEKLKPIPAMHIAGKADEVVLFENQRRTMEAIGKHYGLSPSEGEPWASAGSLVGTIYGAKTATPFITLIHAGTHKYPTEAPALIIKFFKEHARP
jgi:polyhydroxybutyrate depolymerase